MQFLRRHSLLSRLALVLVLVIQQATQVVLAALPESAKAAPETYTATEISACQHSQHLPSASDMLAEALEEATEEETDCEENLYLLNAPGFAFDYPALAQLVALAETTPQFSQHPARRLNLPIYLWCRILLI